MAKCTVMKKVFCILFMTVVSSTVYVLLMGEEVRAEEVNKVVFVLFDITDSTKKERQKYNDEFYSILKTIQPGDVIAADKISEDSISKSAVPVNEEFEKLSFLDDTAFNRKKLFKKQSGQKAKITKTVEEILFGQNYKVKSTDILSSLHIAERVFQKYRKDKYVLVIMSDMIEESRDYNFVSDRLTDRRINEIISLEKSKKRMPDLSGVKVYVTGATAINRDDFFAVQNFWLRYFKECGASFAKEDYGSALIRFDE